MANEQAPRSDHKICEACRRSFGAMMAEWIQAARDIALKRAAEDNSLEAGFWEQVSRHLKKLRGQVV